VMMWERGRSSFCYFSKYECGKILRWRNVH
jgi:hypothetical protein